MYFWVYIIVTSEPTSEPVTCTSPGEKPILSKCTLETWSDCPHIYGNGLDILSPNRYEVNTISGKKFYSYK